MPKKKKHKHCLCRDCDVDFVVSSEIKNVVYCPSCGDSINTQLIKNIWMERPFQYKRPWTKDDDELLLDGIKANYSRQAIADELNRTRKAVNRRYSQLKKRGVAGEMSSMQ